MRPNESGYVLVIQRILSEISRHGDEEIYEKMDVEKMAKSIIKEGGNVVACSSSKSLASVRKMRY